MASRGDGPFLHPLLAIKKKEAGDTGLLDYIFLGFIEVIFIALFKCIEHPAISFCDIDDFAAVISCIAIV